MKIINIILLLIFVSFAAADQYGPNPGTTATQKQKCSDLTTPTNESIACLMVEFTLFYINLLYKINVGYSIALAPYVRCIAADFSSPLKDAFLELFNGYINGMKELETVGVEATDVWSQKITKYCPNAVYKANALVNKALSSAIVI